MIVRWWLAIVLLAACKRVVTTSGPPSAQQVARACVELATCDPTIETVESCTTRAAFDYGTVSAYRPEQLRCIADAAGDCAEVFACIGVSQARCTTDTVRCDGDFEVRCQNTIEYRVDCAGGLWYTEDGTCVGSRCGVGSCQNPGMRACNGTRVESCEFDGVLTAVDCAVTGETCIDDASFPRCGTLRAPPCEFTFCDGDVLVTCDGIEHRTDCSTLLGGGQCSARAARCGFGDGCSPGTPPACFGDTIVVCALGKQVELDCRQLGFAGCSNGGCVR